VEFLYKRLNAKHVQDQPRIREISDFYKFDHDLKLVVSEKLKSLVSKEKIRTLQRNRELYKKVLETIERENNIKKQVVLESPGIEEIEKKYHIDLAGLDNLNALDDLHALLNLASPLYKYLSAGEKLGLQQLVIDLTGESLSSLIDKNSPLLKVYADEIIQGFYKYFEKHLYGTAQVKDVQQISEHLLNLENQKKYQKTANQAALVLGEANIKNIGKHELLKTLEAKLNMLSHENLKSLQELFNRLNVVREGIYSFKLFGRNMDDILSAEMTGDCTNPGDSGFNFWTVPAWLVNRGFNMIYFYGPDQKLIYKAGLLVTLNQKEQPLLVVDSIEVGGDYRKSYDQTKEEHYMNLLINQVRQMAQRMKIDPENIYSQSISNTGSLIEGLGQKMTVVHRPIVSKNNFVYRNFFITSHSYFQSSYRSIVDNENFLELENEIRKYIDQKKRDWELLKESLETQNIENLKTFFKIYRRQFRTLKTGRVIDTKMLDNFFDYLFGSLELTYSEPVSLLSFSKNLEKYWQGKTAEELAKGGQIALINALELMPPNDFKRQLWDKIFESIDNEETRSTILFGGLSDVFGKSIEDKLFDPGQVEKLKYWLVSITHDERKPRGEVSTHFSVTGPAQTYLISLNKHYQIFKIENFLSFLDEIPYVALCIVGAEEHNQQQYVDILAVHLEKLKNTKDYLNLFYVLSELNNIKKLKFLVFDFLEKNGLADFLTEALKGGVNQYRFFALLNNLYKTKKGKNLVKTIEEDLYAHLKKIGGPEEWFETSLKGTKDALILLIALNHQQVLAQFKDYVLNSKNSKRFFSVMGMDPHLIEILSKRDEDWIEDFLVLQLKNFFKEKILFLAMHDAFSKSSSLKILTLLKEYKKHFEGFDRSDIHATIKQIEKNIAAKAAKNTRKLHSTQ